MPAFTKMYILGPFQINLKFLYLVLEYWTTFDSSFRFLNFFWESCPVFQVGISNPKCKYLFSELWGRVDQRGCGQKIDYNYGSHSKNIFIRSWTRDGVILRPLESISTLTDSTMIRRKARSGKYSRWIFFSCVFLWLSSFLQQKLQKKIRPSTFTLKNEPFPIIFHFEARLSIPWARWYR